MHWKRTENISEATLELGACAWIFTTWATQRTLSVNTNVLKNNLILLTAYTWFKWWLIRLKPHFPITKKRTLIVYYLEDIKSGSCLQFRRYIDCQLFHQSEASFNYLVNVYSLSPEWRFMAEKVPMQPRSRLSRPVFHVTKSGLKKQNTKHSPATN